ncbi:hypothetical protein [Bradyrhizobium sp. JR3.5]
MIEMIDIDPTDYMEAKSGIDCLFTRLDRHLFKCCQENKNKRLSLSLGEVEGFRNILTAAQRVLSALGDDSGNPDGGGTRVVGNVIYPDAFRRRAA